MKESIVAIAIGIIGLATIAVIVGQGSNAANIFRTAFSGFGNVLGVAMGNSTQIDLSYTN